MHCFSEQLCFNNTDNKYNNISKANIHFFNDFKLRTHTHIGTYRSLEKLYEILFIRHFITQTMKFKFN